MMFDLRAARSDSRAVAMQSLIYFPNVFHHLMQEYEMAKTYHPRYVTDDVSLCLRTSSIIKESQSRIWNLRLGAHSH